MTNKAIFLNGPRGCGKTEVVKMFSNRFDVIPLNFKDHLHELTMRFFLIDEEEYWSIYNNRSLKESPLHEFRVEENAYEELCEVLGVETNYLGRNRVGFKCNLSIREAMIFVSECVCKPTFGRNYFGYSFLHEMHHSFSDKVYIDDSTAFEEELTPIIDKMGQDSIILIRIHGRGDFSNDSRNYIPDGVVNNTIDVYNTGSEQKYLNTMRDIITNFIEEE